MKKKNNGGRPTAYKKEYAQMAQFCIEDSGFSMYKLAKLFNVTRSTIYRWIEHEKEFSDAVDKGRKIWEGLKIHQSLVKRAVGFSYTETTREAKPIVFIDNEGNETIQGNKLLITKKVRKHYPADVAAIKWWQINRDPEKWQEKQKVEAELTGEMKIEVVNFNYDKDSDTE